MFAATALRNAAEITDDGQASGRVVDLALKRVRLSAQCALARLGGKEADPELRDALAHVEHELTAARQTLGAGPGARLCAALGLSDEERSFFWSLVARALDPFLLPLLRILAGNDGRRGLSLGHHAVIFALDDAACRRLTRTLEPSHPLRRYGIVVAAEPGEVDVTTPLTIVPRVLSFLLGGDEPDEALFLGGGAVEAPREPIYDDAQRAALERLALHLAGDEPLVIVVEGSVGTGRRSAVAAAAARQQKSVFELDASRVPAGAIVPALDALRRECLLRGAVPLIAEVDELSTQDGDGRGRLIALSRALEQAAGPVAVTSSVRGMDLGVRERRLLRVSWPVPDTAARQALWVRELGRDAEPLRGGELDELALRYHLGAGGVRAAVSAARLLAEPGGGVGLTTGDLVKGVRSNIAERLGELAQRVEVAQSWDDLVLPPDTLCEVNALIARVRHAHQVYERWGFQTKMPRGLGVAALFSGPPGTGKTMVAGLLAKELDLELYQIDLSKVVSKWVGETEKQLAKIFEAADAGHALLLFDEADSLFARRTEVRSAVDRYANLEVNYLLQRIESFGGFTILTTNLDTGIDPALRRRLASHIVFEPPEHAESVTLWKRMLTADAPLEEPLHLDELADEYASMVGANIRNAVLAAAFMAASEGAAITHGHLMRGALGEYRAMGRVLASHSRRSTRRSS